MYQFTDLQWNHEQKIETVKRKLDGVNPVEILTTQIRNNRAIATHYRDDCIRLLRKPNSPRLSLPEINLTASQQVISCLFCFSFSSKDLVI